MPQEFTLAPSPRRSAANAVQGDMVRGEWSPTFSFQTPGDLSVAYTTRNGWYVRTLDFVVIYFYLNFSPTYSTASGTAHIDDVPYGDRMTENVYSAFGFGKVTFSAGYSYGLVRTDTTLDNLVLLQAGSTSAGFALVTTTNIPSGTTFVNIAGQISYRII